MPTMSSSVPKPDGSGSARGALDAAVFLAVVVTGLILILTAHVGPDALGGYFLALAALFTAWRHR